MLEFRIRKENGVVVWILGQAVPVNSDKGYVGTLTNINKRKQLLGDLLNLRESI